MADLDGISAGLIGEHFGSFDKIVFMDYDFELEPENQALLESFDEIVIADLSVNREYWDKLLSMGKKLRCYDHHDSSSWLTEYPEQAVHDQKRSGAEILFDEHFSRKGRFKAIVREFITLVATYDLWKDEDPLFPEAQNLSRVLFGYRFWNEPNIRDAYFRFFDNTIKKLERFEHWSWTSEETAMIERAKVREQDEFNTALRIMRFRKDTQGRTFGVYHAGAKISIVCYRIFKETSLGEQLDYIICCNDFKDGWGKLSGRSKKGGFAVNSLKALDGHEPAAGGYITYEEAKMLYADPWCLRHDSEEGDDLLAPTEEISIRWRKL